MKFAIPSRKIFSLALAVYSVASAGCGYHVAGRSSTLPKSIHVIAVPALENKTTAYRIEQRLTAATVHEFLSKTQYRIVSNPDSADAVLRGKVLSIEVTPLTFQQTSTTTPTGPTTPPAVTSVAQATSMLVIMTCDVTLTDRDHRKGSVSQQQFCFPQRISVGGDSQLHDHRLSLPSKRRELLPGRRSRRRTYGAGFCQAVSCPP